MLRHHRASKSSILVMKFHLKHGRKKVPTTLDVSSLSFSSYPSGIRPSGRRILIGAGLDSMQPTREVAPNVIGPTSPGGLPDWTLMLSWKVGHNRQLLSFTE